MGQPMIPKQAIIAAREAMREVTPPPGVSKAEWLEEYGSFALIAGAIAAATPFIRARAFAEADGVMVDRLQAAVSAALALAQEWEYERANFEEIHDYSNYRLSVLNNAAQKLRDAIGAALRGQQ
jgi:hypothetical protein